MTNPFGSPRPDLALGVVSTEDIPGLYRAAHAQDWDQQGTIHARQWVTSSMAWPLVEAAVNDDDPASLVNLSHERGNLPPPASLEKLIAEAVYERVRQEVVPDAPSRLDCVFAALDAYAAMDFVWATSTPPIIDPETGWVLNWPLAKLVSTGGRPWIALDMTLFSMHQETAQDEGGIVEQIGQLEAQARNYWQGQRGQAPIIEILVEAVDLLGVESRI